MVSTRVHLAYVPAALLTHSHAVASECFCIPDKGSRFPSSQVAGSLAAGQLVFSKLLFAKDREATLKSIKYVLTTCPSQADVLFLPFFTLCFQLVFHGLVAAEKHCKLKSVVLPCVECWLSSLSIAHV